MKHTKPKKEDFTRPFNDKLVLFDDKAYLKKYIPYANELEEINAELLENLKLSNEWFKKILPMLSGDFYDAIKAGIKMNDELINKAS